MSRLLHAGFRRLRKDKIFWLTAACILGLSLLNIYNNTRSAHVMAQSGYHITLDKYFFNQAPYAGLFCAIFISLFLGCEYSDGIIRNKLIIGHKRMHVYLSNFLVCLAADFVFLASWILCQIPGFFTIGPMDMGISGFLAYLGIAVCFTVSLTAIFLFCSMLTTNRAFTVVIALIVWIILVVAASGINDRLDIPPTQGGMAFIDGEFKMIEETPNPMYVSGTARLVLECILDFLPTGQAILMTDAAVTHPFREMLFSLLLTIIMLSAGIRYFSRKDIK